jgi:predicted nucleic acid-binding protein
MMSRILVDTSALLALANKRDQFHDRATRAARRLMEAGDRLVGTTLVLAEFQGLLLSRGGPARARAVTSALLDDPGYEWIEVPGDVVRSAVSNWLERYHDQRFSLTDAVSFEVMRREGLVEAFAYDRNFKTAGFVLVV